MGLLAVAVVTNLRGITVAGRLQDAATSVVVLATLVVALLALTRSGHELHTPFAPLHGHGAGDFLQAVALGVFLYSAFEWVTTNAEEVRRPESVNRGMLIALGILCVVCATATVAMSHTLTHGELTSSYPQLYLGIAAFGHAGLWVMAAVTAVTALNTFNGGFITASRFIYGTAREGSLPRQLAQLNDRAVPWVPGRGAWHGLGHRGARRGPDPRVAGAGGRRRGARGDDLRGGRLLRPAAASARQPDAPRPFRVRWLSLLGPLGIALFALLAVTASLSVQNHFNPVPLVIIAVAAGLSSYYVLAILPGLKTREATRRAARPRRRPGR